MIARKRQEMAAWRIAARSSIHGQQKAYASDAGGSNGLSQSGVWFGLLAAGAVFGNYLGGFGVVRPLLTKMLHTTAGFAPLIRLTTGWLGSGVELFWWPLLCGLAATVFVWSLVYLDSDRPGVSPPSPLSPTQTARKMRYRSGIIKLRAERTCHINYMMALASGTTVFLLTIASKITMDE